MLIVVGIAEAKGPAIDAGGGDIIDSIERFYNPVRAASRQMLTTGIGMEN